MNTYTPVIDVNTKVVYKWLQTDSSGNITKISIPKSDWRPVNTWTTEDLENLFGVQKVENTVEVAPEPEVHLQSDTEALAEDYEDEIYAEEDNSVNY
jgi:hypothetical protein